MLIIHIFNSVCVYHSDTMKYLQRELPKCDEECDQMASSFTTMILFSGFAMEPRIGLGVVVVIVSPSTVVIRGEHAIVHEVAIGVGTSEPRSELFETMFMGV
ncbi:hypothetical protein HBI40_160600 [Parastagonospora nodorum]|nr:hypothetical protein HBI40_160600 [Parastagonospora nodorum]